jgi:hypothetical protein
MALKFPFPVVQIVWHDACTTYGWEAHDEVDVNEELCTTIGFLVARGPETIVVASSIDATNNNSRIKIPVGMVKTINELQVTHKKPKKEQEVAQ